MLSSFPRDVLGETWDLIESISERFPTYSLITSQKDCEGRVRAAVGITCTSSALQWQEAWYLYGQIQSGSGEGGLFFSDG